MSENNTASFGFRDVPEAERKALCAGLFLGGGPLTDQMNDLMSAGVHRIWKDAMVEWLNPQPGWKSIDVAGGTGDIAFRIVELARNRGWRSVRAVTDYDINEKMVGEGKRRADAKGEAAITWTVGDAEALPVPDASFDSLHDRFRHPQCHPYRKSAGRGAAGPEARGRFLAWNFPRSMSRASTRSMTPIPSNCCRSWVPGWRAMRNPIAIWPKASAAFPAARNSPQMIGAAGLGQVEVRILSGGHRRHAFGLAALMASLLLRLIHAALLLLSPALAFRAGAAGRGAQNWPVRWKDWGRPISSWARCWRRGPISSAWRWPKRWNICRTGCRLFRKRKPAP